MCCKPAVGNKNHCQQHLDLMKLSKKNARQRDREAAFNHYGQSCNICGTSIEMFLTIDHIDENGGHHRRELSENGYGSSGIYRWLRENDYPKGFQTLCRNCNYAKHLYGVDRIMKAIEEDKNSNVEVDGFQYKPESIGGI